MIVQPAMVPSQRPEATPDSADTPRERAFADVVKARAPRGDPKPAEGEAAAPNKVHLAEATRVDVAPGEVVRAGASRADVFNENGFFAATGGIGGASTEVVPPPGSIQPAEAVALSPPDAISTAVSPTLRPSAHTPASPSPGDLPVRRSVPAVPARPSQASSTSVAPMPPQRTPVGIGATPTDTPTVAGPARRILMRAAAQGARSAVRISLSEVEQGLCVLVSTEALGDVERGELRDAIAALLSRHGLPQHRIQINARVR